VFLFDEQRKEEEAMPDLCQDSDDDEDDILNYYVCGAEKKSLEEMVPRRFRRWMKVFEKKASETNAEGGSHGIMQSKMKTRL